MASAVEPVSVARLRFGMFELDPVAEELRKAGLPIRIQSQPLRILLYLAQRPGQIVSREELHRTFWKAHTTVDLDRSLAAAIHKIRECLDDSVTNPRFLETLSRSGYRFIAPVTHIQPDTADPAQGLLQGPQQRSALGPSLTEDGDAAPAAPSSSMPASAGMQRLSASGKRVGVVFFGVVVLAVLLFCATAFRSSRPNSPAIHAITHNASVTLTGAMSQGFPGAVVDNARIYFARHEDGRGELAVVMLDGGDTTTISLPKELGNPVPDDVSPDGQRLLLRDRLSSAPEQALWVTSPAGQTARQVPGALAHDSAWMPDGGTILYANGNSLYTVQDDGSKNAHFASLPGRPYHMRWSADGSAVRLTVQDDLTRETTLWQIEADGSGAHQILKGWHSGEPVCCGSFLSTGDLYIFQAGEDGAGGIWAVPVRQKWLMPSREPFRLAEGPLSYTSPTAARSGRGVILTGFDPSFRLLSWSSAEHRLMPAPPFLDDAARVELSPDGRWIAWVRRDDGTLWRSRADGADRVRVIGAPYQVFSMAWSPDGARLAVMARRPGSPWRILLTDVQSSHTEELVRDDPHNEADPQWEKGGSSIIFGRLPPRLAEPSLARALFRVDIATRRVMKVDGSDGLFSPRISPDGHTLVALNADQTVLRQLDFATGGWSTATTAHIDDPIFLRDGHAVVYRDFSSPGFHLVRLDLATHQESPFPDGFRAVLDLDDPAFAGLLAGDMPAISLARKSADLYELQAPE